MKKFVAINILSRKKICQKSFQKKIVRQKKVAKKIFKKIFAKTTFFANFFFHRKKFAEKRIQHKLIPLPALTSSVIGKLRNQKEV